MRRTLGFDIPVCGATWSQGEYAELLCSLFAFGWRAGDEQVWLLEYLAHTFKGRATLFNSGRSALEVALRNVAAKRAVRRQASVMVPSLVCRTVPQKVLLCGMTPVFYDIRPNMIPCERSLRDAVRHDTVAVVYPYLYGKVGGIGTVAEFCKARGLSLIEDCAAAFLVPDESGSLAGLTGDYAVFSFQQGKTIVAGSGGALIDRWESSIGEQSSSEPRSPWEEWRLCLCKVAFLTQSVWRSTGYAIEKLMGESGPSLAARTQEQVRPLSAIDARLVRRQIPRWESRRERKIAIIDRYARNLAACPLLAMPQHQPGQFVSRLFIQYPEPILRRLDDDCCESKIVAFLQDHGIQTQLSYYPVHRLRQFADFALASLPCTESLYQSVIEVPSQVSLRDDEIDRVSETLIKSVALLRN